MTYAACTAAAPREAYPGAPGFTYKARYFGCMPLTASNIDPATRAVTRVDASGLLPPVRIVSFMMPIHCRTGSGTEAAAGTGCNEARAANRAIRNRVALGKKRFFADIFLPPLHGNFVFDFWGPRSPRATSLGMIRRLL